MATTTFSMRMDTDVKRRLEEQAALEDRSAAYIANRAIEDFLAREAALKAAVQDALDDDDGVRTSGEAVMAWMSRWADGHDEPMPEPDIFIDMKKSARAG